LWGKFDFPFRQGKVNSRKILLHKAKFQKVIKKRKLLSARTVWASQQNHGVKGTLKLGGMGKTS